VKLLRECGTAKLLRECGTGKLLRACPPPSDDLPEGCYSEQPCANCEEGAEKRTPVAWDVLAFTIGELGCRNHDVFLNTHLDAVALSGGIALFQFGWPSVSEENACIWKGSGLCWSAPDYWENEESVTCSGEPDGQLGDINAYFTLTRNWGWPYGYFEVTIEFPDLPLFDAVLMSVEAANCRSTLSFTGTLTTNTGTVPVGLTLGVRCPV
jgi:hypothetical protein